MKSTPRHACLALGTLLLGAGCLTTENSERQQLAALEKGIESDRFAVDRSMPRVAKEEASADPAAPHPAPAPLAPPPVAGGFEAKPVETDDLSETGPTTVIRIRGKSAPTVQVVPGVAPAPEGAANPARGTLAPSGSEAQSAYDSALSLVNAHAYDRAVGALGVFLLEWPSDPNASNAMYWQAECYYAMGEYIHASELLEQAIERFANSSRVPDDLLKLGLCEEKLGDAAKAKGYFDRLRADYPKSEAVRRIPTGG
jgi:tol-pal system protein YbgF